MSNVRGGDQRGLLWWFLVRFFSLDLSCSRVILWEGGIVWFSSGGELSAVVWFGREILLETCPLGSVLQRCLFL